MAPQQSTKEHVMNKLGWKLKNAILLYPACLWTLQCFHERRWVNLTPVFRVHSVFNNFHILDITSNSQLDVQCATVLQYDFADCNSPAIAVIFSFYCNEHFLLVPYQETDEEKVELASLLHDYELRRQKTDQDIQKNRKSSPMSKLASKYTNLASALAPAALERFSSMTVNHIFSFP